MLLLRSTSWTIYSQEMLQFLLLSLSTSIRILSARQRWSESLLVSFISMLDKRPNDQCRLVVPRESVWIAILFMNYITEIELLGTNRLVSETERHTTIVLVLQRKVKQEWREVPFCTCSFTVACADEGLVKFFSRARPSQLCSVEPYQQHPVSMFFVAVLACGWTWPCTDGQNSIYSCAKLQLYSREPPAYVEALRRY